MLVEVSRENMRRELKLLFSQQQLREIAWGFSGSALTLSERWNSVRIILAVNILLLHILLTCIYWRFRNKKHILILSARPRACPCCVHEHTCSTCAAAALLRTLIHALWDFMKGCRMNCLYNQNHQLKLKGNEWVSKKEIWHFARKIGFSAGSIQWKKYGRGSASLRWVAGSSIRPTPRPHFALILPLLGWNLILGDERKYVACWDPILL